MASLQHLYITDDNIEFGTLIADVAKEVGWNAIVCSNGRELVDELQHSGFSALILLDVLMPELDGIETIERLALMKQDLRVRFMTGGARSNAIAAEHIAEGRGLNLGPTIMKPIRLGALREELQQELQVNFDRRSKFI